MENAKDAILGGEELGISGIACYQPFDGLMELKLVLLFHSYIITCVFMNIHLK